MASVFEYRTVHNSQSGDRRLGKPPMARAPVTIQQQKRDLRHSVNGGLKIICSRRDNALIGQSAECHLRGIAVEGASF
jgi:hypothetical protein